MIRRKMVAIIGAAGLLFAGFGSDDDSATSKAESATGATEADATVATEAEVTVTTEAEVSVATDAEGPAYDESAVMRVQYFTSASADPAESRVGYDAVTLFPVYDRLVHSDPETGEPIPGLAESWEFLEDGTVFRLHLREGINFTDGEPFNAAAVKANLERTRDNPESPLARDLAIIEDVVAVDSLTVDLHLNAPGAHLPLLLSDRHGCMISPAAMQSPDLDTNPVGIGMFTVEEWLPNERHVYVRNENYWDQDAVNVARLEITINSDPVPRLNAVRSGQADLALIDPAQAEEARGGGLTVERRASTAFWVLLYDIAREPWTDKAFREAVNYAIDREGLVEGLFFGEGVASSQIFPEDYFAFNSSVGTERFPYDPEQARQLLEESGHVDVTIEIAISSLPAQIQMAEAIAAQLGEVGINVDIRAIEPAQTAEVCYFTVPKCPVGIVRWSGRPDPAQTVRDLFTQAGTFNLGGSLESVESLYVESGMIQAEADRAETLQQISLQITEEALAAPLLAPGELLAYSANVAGLTVSAAGVIEFRGAGIVSG